MSTSLSDQVVRKTITDRGDVPGGGTPEDLDAMSRSYFKLWGEIAKANDIRAD